MIIFGLTIKICSSGFMKKILLTEYISNDKITQEDELFLVKNSTSGGIWKAVTALSEHFSLFAVGRQ